MAGKRSVSGFLSKKKIRSQGEGYNFLKEEDKLLGLDGSPSASPSLPINSVHHDMMEGSISRDDADDPSIAQDKFYTRSVSAKPVKAEPVKAESVKAESVKSEPVKAEPVKAEPVKAEPVSVGTIGNTTEVNLASDRILVPLEVASRIKKGELSLRESQIMMIMCEESNCVKNRDFALSYNEISLRANMHQPHIPKTLNLLIERGLIKRNRGVGNKNFYQLTV